MLQWLWCFGGALAGSAITFWGIGGLLHHHFYRRQRANAAEWKLQPKRWLTPALERQAFWLGSLNLLIGSLGSGTLAWYLRRGGWSTIYYDVHRYGYAYLLLSIPLGFFAIDATLYYSHRLLHQRTMFRYIHRWHHRYVAPTVFATTAMHPLEILTMMFCVTVPAFVIPMHVGVYIFLIVYTYFIGMLDHSGVRINWMLPFHRDNGFHDDHHVYFHCNYGHHTQLFDRFHGTARRLDRHYDEHTFGGRGAVLAKAAPPKTASGLSR